MNVNPLLNHVFDTHTKPWGGTKEIHSIIEGQPPEINLINEKNNGESVLEIIKKDLVNSVHDVSNGGLIVALAEMSMGSNYGVKINKPKNLTNSFKYFFGEDQSRYILEIDEKHSEQVKNHLKVNNIYFDNIGNTQKKYFEIQEEMKIDINVLFNLNNQRNNNF